MFRDKSNLLSWIKFAVGWPLSAISIFFIIKLIIDKSGELDINLSNLNLFYLMLGIVFFFLYFLMRSFLWQVQLKEKGYKIKFPENTYRFAFSEVKRYTPGNIWSFLSRASQFSELGVDKKTIGISILADIQLVIIGSLLASFFTLPWIIDTRNTPYLNLSILSFLSLIGIVIFFISTYLIYNKKYSTSILRRNRVESLSSLLLPGFEMSSKIELIAIATLTYFIFGVGNFFAALSIYNLGFSQFLSLSSFFTFSLLVGYLSFITPTGLGVREGIVTLGLSKIVNTQTAAAISIYTRIILVVSELIFLFSIFLWRNFSKK